MKDLKTKTRFIELRAEGHSYAKIASELQIAKQTLINWSRELKEELHNHRTIRWNSILEGYKLSEDQRLVVLAQNLKRVSEELETRALSEVSTDKLILLSARLSADLDDLMSQMTFRRGSSLREVDVLFGGKDEWKS